MENNVLARQIEVANSNELKVGGPTADEATPADRVPTRTSVEESPASKLPDTNEPKVDGVSVLAGQVEVATSNRAKDCPAADGGIPNSVRVQIGSLIERYGLSREQLLSIYDSCVSDKSAGSPAGAQPTPESREEPAEEEEEEEPEEMVCENGSGEGAMEGQQEVGKMQSLVRSALESYTSSPASELGSKRKLFTLEEELRLQPTPFASELLDRDQTIVAHAIKRYMAQYSIPQREVVEKTGLNQSHLSQHFLHGVTMKRPKRIKLYHWFEDDQQLRTGKIQSADGSLSAVLESPRVEGTRRRPRWKWSPISTQILSEAFKKNQFPTREQRLELARVCNDAEITMNNGTVARGPEGDTEGITEQRINTWFTNRRKGLTTPSPTRRATPGSTPLLAPSFPPPLLKATPATTPATPGSLYSESAFTPERSSSLSGLMPTTVQTLVNQIQQAQVASSSASSLQQSSSQVAVPLAIALPTASHHNILSPSTSAVVSSPQQSIAPMPTLLSQNQMQTIISQLQGTPLHLPAHNLITLPTGATVVNANSSPSSNVHALSIPEAQRATPESTAVTQVQALDWGTQVQALVSQMHLQKIEGSNPQFQFVALPSFSVNAGEDKAVLLGSQTQSTRQ